MPLSDTDKAELVAYLDGELDEQATQMVEARLATDADARAELETLKQTWGMLDYRPKASPSPNFTNRTMERLSLEKLSGQTTASSSKPNAVSPRRPVGPALAWTAGVLLAIGAGYAAAPQMFALLSPADPPPQEADELLIRNLRVVEKWRYYENVDDLNFLKNLCDPELFGKKPG